MVSFYKDAFGFGFFQSHRIFGTESIQKSNWKQKHIKQNGENDSGIYPTQPLGKFVPTFYNKVAHTRKGDTQNTNNSRRIKQVNGIKMNGISKNEV